MSDSDNMGFGKFVPGFDFLNNLTKSAAAGGASMPHFSKWVAPTLDAQELERRIEELKIVRFWLEQNSNALAATIQAMEVQKMTLETLKGMNFQFGDSSAAAAAEPAPEPEPSAQAQADSSKPGVIDPLQMWGALTQQFQKIAENAVKDASSLAAQAAAQAAQKPAATPDSPASPAGAAVPPAAAKKAAAKTSKAHTSVRKKPPTAPKKPPL